MNSLPQLPLAVGRVVLQHLAPRSQDELFRLAAPQTREASKDPLLGLHLAAAEDRAWVKFAPAGQPGDHFAAYAARRRERVAAGRRRLSLQDTSDRATYLDNFDLVLRAVCGARIGLRRVPADLLHERSIVLAALALRGQQLAWVPEAGRNLEVCVLAVQQDDRAMAFVPQALVSAVVEATEKVAPGRAVQPAAKPLAPSTYLRRTSDLSAVDVPPFCGPTAEARVESRSATAFLPPSRSAVHPPPADWRRASPPQPIAHYREAQPKNGASCGEPLKDADDAEIRGVERALAAVRKDGLDLRRVRGAARNNLEVNLAAVRQNGLAYTYTSPHFRTERRLALAAVAQNGLALAALEADFRDDVAVALAAVRQNGHALQHVGRHVAEHVDVIRVAIYQCGQALQYVRGALRSDVQINQLAVRRDRTALKWVLPTLQEDFILRSLALDENLDGKQVPKPSLGAPRRTGANEATAAPR